MTDGQAPSPNAGESPLEEAGTEDRRTEPVPRLATPAAEQPAESVAHQRAAVGDDPEVGGPTSGDTAS